MRYSKRVRAQEHVVEFRFDEDDEGDPTVLRMAIERAAPASGVDEFQIDVEAPGVTCSHRAATSGGDGLETFFEELARDWQGWEAMREWHSLERGIGIQAQHLGSEVRLLFTLRSDVEPESWVLSVPIVVEAGESLRRVAGAVARLIRTPQ